MPAECAGRRCWPWGFAAGYGLVALVYLALLVAGARGPRGTDQFWYLSDTEALLAGSDVANAVYPGPLLRGEATVEDYHFIHNSPVVQLASVLAVWLGAYRAWLVLNAVAALGSAALVATIVHRRGTRSAAFLSFAVVLLLPTTVWQSTNVLQEVSFGLVSAVVVFGLTLLWRQLWGWVLLLLWSTMAVLCHPMYVLAAVGVPVFMVWQLRGSRPRVSALLAVASWALTVYVVMHRAEWLPSTLLSSAWETIVNSLPGRTNFEWYLRGVQVEPTVGLLVHKAAVAVLRQVPVDSPVAIFYWPVNVLLALAALSAWVYRRDGAVRRLALAAGGFVVIVMAIDVLHQNQYRYMALATPGLVALCGVQFARWRPGGGAVRRWGLVWVVGVALLAVDVVLVGRSAAESRRFAQMLASLEPLAEHLGGDDRLLVDVDVMWQSLPLTYAVRPRRCLTIRHDWLREGELDRLLEAFGPTHVVCRPETGLSEVLGGVKVELSLPPPLAGYAVYDLPSR